MTWTDQPIAAGRVTRKSDRPTAKGRPGTVAGQAMLLELEHHLGDLRRTPGAGAATTSVTRAGAMVSAAHIAATPCISSQQPFLSSPMLAPPLFPRPSLRGGRTLCCSAP